MRNKLLLTVAALAVVALASAPASSAAECPAGQTGTPPYCAPNPSPPGGTLKAAPKAPVKRGKAVLKVACSAGPCKGTLKLTAKIKKGKKRKKVVIGRAPFSLAAGASKKIKVKLTRAAKKELKKRKKLKAKVTGPGVVTSKVKLKPAKKKHKR